MSKALPLDFDWIQYTALHNDIKNKSKEEAERHYLKHGDEEKRPYKIDKIAHLPSGFNTEIYKSLHADLANLSSIELMCHYLKDGKAEGRPYKKATLTPATTPVAITSAAAAGNSKAAAAAAVAAKRAQLGLPSDTTTTKVAPKDTTNKFQWEKYFQVFPAVGKAFNTKDVFVSLKKLGLNYPETAKLDILLKNEKFMLIYNQCAEEYAMQHWIANGSKQFDNLKPPEGSTAKIGNGNKKEQKEITLPPDFNWQEYLKENPDLKFVVRSELDATTHYLKTGYFEGRSYIHPKIGFRQVCERLLTYLRNIDLPEVLTTSKYEAVLIEFRCFPHVEFLLRNNILKIGHLFSFTVVCGNLNFEFMTDLCTRISPNIKVLKVDKENVLPSEYSELLASLDFWNLFSSEKILLFQEDSIIFRSNIQDFLDYDYIGAPWPLQTNDTEGRVGNGGFSLRTRQIMLTICENFPIKETEYSASTLKYMEESKLTIPPEDVYFALNIEKHQLGRLPTAQVASYFSTESIKNLESFGGHKFWVSDRLWRDRVYSLCPQFSPSDIVNTIQQRGWDNVIEEMRKFSSFNEKSSIDFVDSIENHFLIEQSDACEKPWAGFIHSTPLAFPSAGNVNISSLISNKNFIISLKHCTFIISFSDYTTKFLKQFISSVLCPHVKIFTIKHPCDTNVSKLFTMLKYSTNEDKKLIQVGKRMRKGSSIYLVEAPSEFQRVWFPGTSKIKDMEKLVQEEIVLFSLPSTLTLDNEVFIQYFENDEDYDEEISKNIVFVHYLDVSASKTILECITRNTPIIVNKLEAVVEYLGENYPLYYKSLDDVSSLLTNEKIEAAHEHLKNMDKEELTVLTLAKKLQNLIYKNFQKADS